MFVASTRLRPLMFKVVIFPPGGGVYRLTWPSADRDVIIFLWRIFICGSR